MQRKYEHLNQQFHPESSLSKQIFTSKIRDTSRLLSINEIMQRNKQMKEEKKMQKLRAIKARKLRIKVTEVFLNFFPLKNNRPKRSSTTTKLSSNLQNIKRGPSVQIKSGYLRLQGPSRSRISRTSSKPLAESQDTVEAEKERTETIMQLFDRFSNAELEQIQQDELYYLGRDELIEIFRKYLNRLRSTFKDTSRASVMRDSYSKSKPQYIEVQTFTTQEAKQYIMEKMGLQREQEPRKLGLHLLTNPLEKPKATSFLQPKPLHKSLKTLQEFKEKQKVNLQKLRAKQEQDRLNFRLDRDYIAGIVRENRATGMDRKKILYTQRNSLHDLKSKQFKDRLQLLKENYGKSVSMAEQIRASFLRLKSKNSKFSLFQ